MEHSLSSIEKAILILGRLGKPPYKGKVSDLARELSLNRTSVYRILQVMKGYDLVSTDSQNDYYRIGPAMYHIGSSYLYKNEYLSNINDLLVEISETIRESVGMAIRDGDRIISIFEIEVHQPMKLNDLPGRYFYPNKGCYGKCLTAYQPQHYIDKMLDESDFEKTLPKTLTTKEQLLEEYATIRKQGWCTSIDEQGIDLLGVGIPLFDPRGAIAACVAVAFFRKDGWEKQLIDARDVLLANKSKLERYFP